MGNVARKKTYSPRITHSVDTAIIEENAQKAPRGEGEYREIFAKRLNVLLDEQKIDQKVLAGDTGIDTTNISNYRNARTTIKLPALVKIARRLEVSVDYLVGNSDVQSTDMNIRAICDYTGLTEASIDFLHWYISEKRNDTYIGGFTEDMFSPKNLINEILGGDTSSSSLDGFVSEFCHGVNGAAEPETDLMIARGSTPDDIKVSEMDWSERVSSREFARLRMEHAKAEFLRMLDEIFKEFCQSKQ